MQKSTIVHESSLGHKQLELGLKQNSSRLPADTLVPSWKYQSESTDWAL